MKVVVVSAHYPPNFVSGGTLVPQRTSRLLAKRGHEVKTYAGWIGDGRAPLEAWDDSDDVGSPVRWIVSTPWMSWSDIMNYDNPAIADDFARYLDRERPDLVHFHSLQTLGVGLVEEAVNRSIPTAVTMHDFWWWCSRQFLCDVDYQPCCLVVESGACECQAGRTWSSRRRARTRAVLERVDAVVAVSEIEARVLQANGVEPTRLRVIENGVVSPGVSEGTSRGRSNTLRLAFTGGDNPMKGLPVLLGAIGHLRGKPGWVLTCYGCEGSAVDPTIEAVITRPAFEPYRLSEVLAETDVVVLPSVARETYSLMTREALSAGVPVVASDSLGAEEVVRDGVNGFVVPAADPDALGLVLSQLVESPALVDQLRAGCLAQGRLPTLEGQVDQLERLYADLASPSAASAAGASIVVSATTTRRPVRRVLFVAGIEGAPLRYRARFPAEALEALGVHTDVRHYRHPDISRLGDLADAVVIYRVPATIQINHFIAGVQRRGTPVFFDVDDLVFDPGIKDEIPALKTLPPDEAALWLEGVLRYRTTMEQCDGFIGSTAMLCRQAEEVTGLAAHRFVNGVGQILAQLSDEALRRPRTPGPPRIGYLSGTNTHDYDWRYVEPAVAETLARYPEVELWLVGLVEPTSALDRFSGRVRRYPLLNWYELPGILRDVDVNLAPLEPSSRFNEAKSAIKWLEAGLTATPTIASPTEPFREAIEHGASGFLAGDGTAWRDLLQLLVGDEVLRRRVGARARREALLGYTSSLQGRRYLDILEQASLGRDRPSVWTPVAHDEPFAAFDLEAYERPSAGPHELVEVIEVGPQVPALPGSTVVLRARAEGLLAAVARSFRTDGAGVTAERIARKLGRSLSDTLGRKRP